MGGLDRKRKEEIAIYAVHAGLQARRQMNRLLRDMEERQEKETAEQDQ